MPRQMAAESLGPVQSRRSGPLRRQLAVPRFAAWIMRGPTQAAAALTASLLIGFALPPFTWLSAAIAALIVLSTGLQGLVRTLPVGLLAALGAGLVLTDSAWTGAAVAAAAWGPVLLIAGTLRGTGRIDLALVVAAVLGWLVVITLESALADSTEVWSALLTDLIDREAGDGEAARLEELVAQIAPLMTGLVAAGSVLGGVTATFLGRWWQAALYNPGAFGREFRGLRLGKTAAVGVAALLAVAAVTEAAWVSGLALVAGTVYALQGLAVVHALVATRGMSRGWLVGLYALTVVMLVQMAVALIIIGIVDAWFDLRARAADRQP